MVPRVSFTHLALPLAVLSGALISGCSNSTVDQSAPNSGNSETAGGTAMTSSAGESGQSDSATGTRIALTPDNTKLAFVGTHVVEEGPDPNARHGEFKKFSGSATLSEDDQLVAITVEIETGSLDTGNGKLNDHLLSADFFDVRENPKAKFVSTEISTSEDGATTITGDLTLLKETKSISFPATVAAGDSFELTAEFSIDRTEFGMTYGADRVEKEVKLSVSVSGP
jgi:polyisoprenoid-binding protein YceI